MNIRNKLIILFVSIVALISIITSLAIYFFASDYRQDEFYRRLENKGRITAKLLIEVDEVSDALLKKIEKDNPINLYNEKMIIYDFNNKVLYSSDEESIIKVDKGILDKARHEGLVRFQQNDYESVGFLYTDKYDRFVVIVAAIDIYGLTALKDLQTIMIVVFVASIIIILISGYLYVGNALKPISKVIREVDDISATSLYRRVDEGNGNDEISRLAHTFNSMLGRLETAFTTQKLFIANASHELRNPLTAILGQIDVCLLSERPPQEYQEVLKSLREDITNLNIVSNRLLLLTQASIEDSEKGFTIQRSDQLLWEAKSELNELHPDYLISIELDSLIDDGSRLNVFADEQLLKSALVNIMDNGCKYSSDHKVNVRLSHGSDNKIILQFKDNGVGISDEDKPHIFEPFYRGKNAKNIKGNGIGLSLVYRIIRSHRGKIEINSSVKSGTNVTVTLPIANHKHPAV
ncbi:MAG: HAMP domain-containing histidine kinase [Bacteroidetes bacterium]|nr:HAMP domain-containing histidine kinase [Bacteroidota bacterium]